MIIKLKHNIVFYQVTPYENGYFKIQLDRSFLLEIEKKTTPIYCIDSYSLQMIIKKLTNIVSKVKFDIIPTEIETKPKLRIGIYTNTKKNVQCIIPISLKQICNNDISSVLINNKQLCDEEEDHKT